MISFLKVFLSLVWLFMVYIVVSTSLKSSLFEEWTFVLSVPWMRATLWDFYANVLIIYLWVLYLERTWSIRILWGVLFFFLGSIGTLGYVLLQLFSLRRDDSIEVLLKQKPQPL